MHSTPTRDSAPSGPSARGGTYSGTRSTAYTVVGTAKTAGPQTFTRGPTRCQMSLTHLMTQDIEAYILYEYTRYEKGAGLATWTWATL